MVPKSTTTTILPKVVDGTGSPTTTSSSKDFVEVDAIEILVDLERPEIFSSTPAPLMTTTSSDIFDHTSNVPSMKTEDISDAILDFASGDVGDIQDQSLDDEPEYSNDDHDLEEEINEGLDYYPSYGDFFSPNATDFLSPNGSFVHRNEVMTFILIE